MRIVAIVFAVVAALVVTSKTRAALAAAASSAPAPAASVAKAHVDLDDIRTFARVFSLVKQAYVTPVSDQRLMRAAIHGMLANLDPHSAFLDRSGLQQLGEDTTGEYAGIGIVVADVNHQLKIIAPLDGTPAVRAGLRAGDTIVSIDGHIVDSANIDEMVDRLRGPVGSKVKLLVLHDSGSAPVAIDVTREKIHVDSASARVLAPGYAYLRVGEFQQDTARELRDAIDKLVKAQGALRGAVLDLRSNPGGLVTSAVAVADTFLDHGAIVSTRGRVPQADMQFSANPGDLLGGAPLVVLIDRGTASAAEIVAGALKDNHRALVMGQRSFGKGSVQTVLPIDADHAIKLTTARYYTPSGTSIQAEGIAPDIALADLAVNPRQTPPTPIITEADLPHHLAAGADAAKQSPAPTATGDLAERDYALSEALHVLQGMAITGGHHRR